jgi:hypothetical protein
VKVSGLNLFRVPSAVFVEEIVIKTWNISFWAARVDRWFSGPPTLGSVLRWAPGYTDLAVVL